MKSTTGKITTTLTLDSGIIASLKVREINVSRLVNNFLLTYLKQTPEELDRNNRKQQILDAEAKILMMKEHRDKLIALDNEIESEKGVIVKFGN